MKSAVIETGGKQYIVREGESLQIELLEGASGDKIAFEKVLLKVDGEKVEIGMPYLKGEKVEATLDKQERGERKIVFRYHSKTRYRKLKTHRQDLTKVTIKKI